MPRPGGIPTDTSWPWGLSPCPHSPLLLLPGERRGAGERLRPGHPAPLRGHSDPKRNGAFFPRREVCEPFPLRGWLEGPLPVPCSAGAWRRTAPDPVPGVAGSGTGSSATYHPLTSSGDTPVPIAPAVPARAPLSRGTPHHAPAFPPLTRRGSAADPFHGPALTPRPLRSAWEQRAGDGGLELCRGHPLPLPRHSHLRARLPNSSSGCRAPAGPCAEPASPAAPSLF